MWISGESGYASCRLGRRGPRRVAIVGKQRFDQLQKPLAPLGQVENPVENLGIPGWQVLHGGRARRRKANASRTAMADPVHRRLRPGRLMRKSSSLEPAPSRFASHRGRLPRPDHVSPGFFGFRYLGRTFGYGRRLRSGFAASPGDRSLRSRSSSVAFSVTILCVSSAATRSWNAHSSSVDMDRKPLLFIESRPGIKTERTYQSRRTQTSGLGITWHIPSTQSSSDSGPHGIGLAHSSGCAEVLSSGFEAVWKLFAVVWQAPWPPPPAPVFEDREVQQCVGPSASESCEEFRPTFLCNHSLQLLDKTTINLTKTMGYIMHRPHELSIMGKLRSLGTEAVPPAIGSRARSGPAPY